MSYCTHCGMRTVDSPTGRFSETTGLAIVRPQCVNLRCSAGMYEKCAFAGRHDFRPEGFWSWWTGREKCAVCGFVHHRSFHKLDEGGM